LPYDQLNATKTNNVLFPDKPSYWGATLGPISQDQYKAVKDGGYQLVVFGRVRYRDTFDGEHYTDFSFVWEKFKEGCSTNDDFRIHPDGYTDAT
jgi:hypothetical protein